MTRTRHTYRVETRGSADASWTTMLRGAPKGAAEGYADAARDLTPYSVRVVREKDGRVCEAVSRHPDHDDAIWGEPRACREPSGYGRCPDCGRLIAVKADGTFWRHRMVTPTRIMRGPYAGEFQPWCVPRL